MFALPAIQFANLSALFAGLLIPLLVLAYLKRKQGRRELVSSLLILQRLSRKRILRKKFKPPLRFFLELLALLLLVAAASLPSYKDRQVQAAVIIDNSLSMRAKSREPGQELRLNEAKGVAKNWLAEQSNSMFTVFSSAPKLKQLGSSGLAESKARELIDAVAPSVSSDNLDASVAELAENGQYDLIYVVTDKEAVFGKGKAAVGLDATDKTAIEVRTVGAVVSNYYLADLQTDSRSDGLGMRVIAQVGYSGRGTVDLNVRLRSVGGETAVNQAVRAKAHGGKTNEVVFDIPGVSDEGQVFKVELDSDSEQDDAILEDDSGWISTKKTISNRALLITPQASGSMGLESIPGFGVQVVTAEEYAKKPVEEIEHYSLLIFYQTAPVTVPKRPTLLVLPPTENGIFPVAKEATSTRISYWQEDHALTSYLRVSLLKPERSLVFSVPPWAKPIINVEAGPVVIAGESRGIRFVGAGFELFPFEGTKTPGLSILTLNILNWLNSGVELADGVVTGGTIRLEGNRKWLIRTPLQRIETINVPPRELSFYTLEQIGLYGVSSLDLTNGVLQKNERSRRTLAVNAFHPLESSTFERLPLVVPQLIVHETSSELQAQPLWPYLMGAVLALSLSELLLGIFTSRREVQDGVS